MTYSGEFVRKRREALGWTVRDAAKASGLSVNFISKVENSVTDPGLSRITKLLKALGVEVQLVIT